MYPAHFRLNLLKWMGNLYYSNVGAAVEVYTAASSGALA
jgi:non-homologous end joining protein Ku